MAELGPTLIKLAFKPSSSSYFRPISSEPFKCVSRKLAFLSFLEPRTMLETKLRSSSGFSTSYITMISNVLSRRPSRMRHFLVTSFLSAHVAFRTRITSSMRSQSLASSSAKFCFFFSAVVSFSIICKRFSLSAS